MKRNRVWVGCMLLWAGLAPAEVRVSVPQDFRILAVSAGRLEDERHALLPDGTQQLLVRYEGVIPSRSGDNNDRAIRSEPQVIRYAARDQQVQLQATVPTDDVGMAHYARTPQLGLSAGGRPLALVQDELVIEGVQIGMDWPARLAEYNSGTGKAVLASRVATTPAPAVPASELEGELEGELQRLFLQADPGLRRRFIGWAVPRL